MIEVTDITKLYGRSVAVDSVSFSLKKGEILGFLGPNGAGKSTILKIISGILSPTKGRVTINGLDVATDSLKIREILGFLPEDSPLYPEMTTYAYLRFFAKIKGITRSVRKQLINDAADVFGLHEVFHTYLGTLSHGYRQRVALAQAFLNDPELLILDEPTNGLDPNQISSFRQFLKSLKGKKTIILSSHILSEVEKVCERVIVLNEGKIVESYNLSQKKKQRKILALKVKRPSSDLRKSLLKIPNVIAVEESAENAETYAIEHNGPDTIAEKIAEQCLRQNAGLIELRLEKPELEQIFAQLTRRQERTLFKEK